MKTADSSQRKAMFQVLGTGSDGVCPSLMLSIEKINIYSHEGETSVLKQYLFNCGEGTTRFCGEHKVKVAASAWAVALGLGPAQLGGLPGLVFAASGAGRQTLRLVGPPGIKQFHASMQSFVRRTHPQIDLVEIPGDGEAYMFEDEHVELVTAVVKPVQVQSQNFGGSLVDQSSIKHGKNISSISTTDQSKRAKPGITKGDVIRNQKIKADETRLVENVKFLLGVQRPRGGVAAKRNMKIKSDSSTASSDSDSDGIVMFSSDDTIEKRPPKIKCKKMTLGNQSTDDKIADERQCNSSSHSKENSSEESSSDGSSSSSDGGVLWFGSSDEEDDKKVPRKKAKTTDDKQKQKPQSSVKQKAFKQKEVDGVSFFKAEEQDDNGNSGGKAHPSQPRWDATEAVGMEGGKENELPHHGEDPQTTKTLEVATPTQTMTLNACTTQLDPPSMSVSIKEKEKSKNETEPIKQVQEGGQEERVNAKEKEELVEALMAELAACQAAAPRLTAGVDGGGSSKALKIENEVSGIEATFLGEDTTNKKENHPPILLCFLRLKEGDRPPAFIISCPSIFHVDAIFQHSVLQDHLDISTERNGPGENKIRTGIAFHFTKSSVASHPAYQRLLFEGWEHCFINDSKQEVSHRSATVDMLKHNALCPWMFPPPQNIGHLEKSTKNGDLSTTNMTSNLDSSEISSRGGGAAAAARPLARWVALPGARRGWDRAPWPPPRGPAARWLGAGGEEEEERLERRRRPLDPELILKEVATKLLEKNLYGLWREANGLPPQDKPGTSAAAAAGEAAAASLATTGAPARGREDGARAGGEPAGGPPGLGVRAFVLGTGCAAPSSHRSASGVLLAIAAAAQPPAAPAGPPPPSPSSSVPRSAAARGGPPDPQRECLILLDAGEQTVGQMERVFGAAATSAILQNLAAIWISHRHGDHHSGLSALLERRSKSAIFKGSSSKAFSVPLVVIAPQAVLEYTRTCMDLIGLSSVGQPRPFFMVHHREFARPDCPVRRAFFAAHGRAVRALRSVPVDHCPDAWGLVLDLAGGEGGEGEGPPPPPPPPPPRAAAEGGGRRAAAAAAAAAAGRGRRRRRVVYSGDTRPCAALAAAGRGAALLLHEATFASNDSRDMEMARRKRHCTASEALAVARDMEAQIVVLTHFSQRYPSFPANLSEECFEDHHPEAAVKRDPTTSDGCKEKGRDKGPPKRIGVVVAFDSLVLDLSHTVMACGHQYGSFKQPQLVEEPFLVVQEQQSNSSSLQSSSSSLMMGSRNSRDKHEHNQISSSSKKPCTTNTVNSLLQYLTSSSQLFKRWYEEEEAEEEVASKEK